jgi:hypothetical protein
MTLKSVDNPTNIRQDLLTILHDAFSEGVIRR